MTPDPPGGAQRLGPPRPGEWRFVFREERQSFEQYAARCRNRKSPGRGVLHLQPLGAPGELPAPLLGLLRGYSEIYFDAEARLHPPLPLPGAAQVPQRDQHNSSMILDELAPRAPGDALAWMGITSRDLFARGKAFVFGESSLVNRTGVLSLARLGSSDPALAARRALRLLSHETGHLLELAHCTTHRCLMQGSNTLREFDGLPLHLCPEDLRKLLWNTGADPRERDRRLEAFYRKAGLAEEAAETARRIARDPGPEGQKGVYSRRGRMHNP